MSESLHPEINLNQEFFSMSGQTPILLLYFHTYLLDISFTTKGEDNSMNLTK